MICFIGSSFAPKHLEAAAICRGVETTNDPSIADILFVSEDTPVAPHGKRDLEPILKLIKTAKTYGKPIVLTSQVPPGFTRSLGIEQIWHQAETLRVKDAGERAYAPEQIIVGGNPDVPIPYRVYLNIFQCPIQWVELETAEFSKIAINMSLAAQVDSANRLSLAADKAGADWNDIQLILKHDHRIGTYTKPGRWQDSLHLLRDWYTLEEILARD